MSDHHTPAPRQWTPGDRIASERFPDDVRTIRERKDTHDGWWLTDGSGLADHAAIASNWYLVDRPDG